MLVGEDFLLPLVAIVISRERSEQDRLVAAVPHADAKASSCAYQI
jgi:hypothetical protein